MAHPPLHRPKPRTGFRHGLSWGSTRSLSSKRMFPGRRPGQQATQATPAPPPKGQATAHHAMCQGSHRLLLLQQGCYHSSHQRVACTEPEGKAGDAERPQVVGRQVGASYLMPPNQDTTVRACRSSRQSRDAEVPRQPHWQGCVAMCRVHSVAGRALCHKAPKPKGGFD